MLNCQKCKSPYENYFYGRKRCSRCEKYCRTCMYSECDECEFSCVVCKEFQCDSHMIKCEKCGMFACWDENLSENLCIEECSSCGFVCDVCAQVYTCESCRRVLCSLCNPVVDEDAIHGVYYCHGTISGCNNCGGNKEEFIELCQKKEFDEAIYFVVKSEWLEGVCTSAKPAVKELLKYMEDKVSEYQLKILYLKNMPYMDTYNEAKK